MSKTTPRGFWTVWTAVAVDLLGFGIVIPLLPLYAERFGAGPATIGMIFASYSLAQFVFAPLWGKLSDRVGRRPVLLVTIAGSALGNLILALAGSVPLLFLGRIVDGASGASVAVARATVADTAEPSSRPRLMGLLGAAFGLGFVVGPTIGALAALGSPSLPFLVAALISLANLVVAWFRVPETRTVGRPEGTAAGLRSLPRPAVRLVVLTFVGVTAFAAFEATFALLGAERLAMTESTVALVFAGVGMVLVVTQAVLVGRLAPRIGEAGSIRLGLLLNAGGFALLAAASSWPALLFGLTALALGQGMLTPTLSSAVAGASIERSGAALGVQQSAGGLARVIGPLVGGSLFALATPLPYAVSGAMSVVALALVPSRESSTNRP